MRRDLRVTPIDDQREGDLLQYSSGTTGRPKGIKRELPHQSPAEAPSMMSGLIRVWLDPDSVYAVHRRRPRPGAGRTIPRLSNICGRAGLASIFLECGRDEVRGLGVIVELLGCAYPPALWSPVLLCPGSSGL